MIEPSTYIRYEVKIGEIRNTTERSVWNMGRMWHSLLFLLFVVFSSTLGMYCFRIPVLFLQYFKFDSVHCFGCCLFQGCKTGWIQFLDKCYHFSTLARDWGVASVRVYHLPNILCLLFNSDFLKTFHSVKKSLLQEEATWKLQ